MDCFSGIDYRRKVIIVYGWASKQIPHGQFIRFEGAQILCSTVCGDESRQDEALNDCTKLTPTSLTIGTLWREFSLITIIQYLSLLGG